MRSSELAAAHGLSAQAVRNYEQDRFLPPAERTPSGYRIYTELHVAALGAFLSLVAAHGHAAGGQIMVAVHDDDLDGALSVIDRAHEQALRDRQTLKAITVPEVVPAAGVRTIGEVARRLGVTPATLRIWETAGILDPARDRAGYRVYHPSDLRDAELAHLLRRGGYPLSHIAGVVRQVRSAGGTEALAASLRDWRERLTARGLAALAAAARLSDYLAMVSR